MALIQVKQHDAIAYPAHLLAARSLAVAGCGKDATRLQWLKAGLHASTDSQIEGIANARVEHASTPTTSRTCDGSFGPGPSARRGAIRSDGC